jgi:hypothetical protein
MPQVAPLVRGADSAARRPYHFRLQFFYESLAGA